jgi:hypothetical protein
MMLSSEGVDFSFSILKEYTDLKKNKGELPRGEVENMEGMRLEYLWSPR